MYVVLTGAPTRGTSDMFKACREALDALRGRAAARPTRSDEVFDAHARVLTKAGYKGHFLNACGYTHGRDLSADVDGLADDLRGRAAGAWHPAWCSSST